MPKFFIGIIVVLMLLGCGRKEIPQLQHGASSPPKITQLSYVVNGQVVKFLLKLEGGRDGIGFQVDRTLLDPHCKCAGSWQRYSEMVPQSRYQGKKVSRMFGLPLEDTTYLFRIRAVDMEGHLSEWSETMQAHSDKNRIK